MPGGPRDTFGIGWARTELSDNLAPFLRQQLKLGLQREDAIEMYYNAALTPWLGATVDLQVIEPSTSGSSAPPAAPGATSHHFRCRFNSLLPTKPVMVLPFTLSSPVLP